MDADKIAETPAGNGGRTNKTQKMNAKSGSNLTSFGSMEHMTSTYESSSVCPTRTLNDSPVITTRATFRLRSLGRGSRLLRTFRDSSEWLLVPILLPVHLGLAAFACEEPSHE